MNNRPSGAKDRTDGFATVAIDASWKPAGTVPASARFPPRRTRLKRTTRWRKYMRSGGLFVGEVTTVCGVLTTTQPSTRITAGGTAQYATFFISSSGASLIAPSAPRIRLTATHVSCVVEALTRA